MYDDMFRPMGPNALALLDEYKDAPHGSSVYVPPEQFSRVLAEIPSGWRFMRNDGTTNVLLPNGLTMRIERV